MFSQLKKTYQALSENFQLFSFLPSYTVFSSSLFFKIVTIIKCNKLFSIRFILGPKMLLSLSAVNQHFSSYPMTGDFRFHHIEPRQSDMFNFHCIIPIAWCVEELRLLSHQISAKIYFCSIFQRSLLTYPKLIANLSPSYQ